MQDRKIRAKRLKNGKLRVYQSGHPVESFDIGKTSEEKRMLPTLLQIVGYTEKR